MASQPNEQLPVAKPRRSNKPLMEKRRRERINQSLSTIKELVLVAEQEDMSKHSKLEKADILEMTVRFLQRLHDNPDLIRKPSDDYKAGFDRCTWAIEDFIQRHQNPTPETFTSLTAHLKSLSQSLREPILPGCAAGCSTGGGKMRVRASLDRSLFKSNVVRHDRVDMSPQINPPFACSSFQSEEDAQIAKLTPSSDAQPVKLELRSSIWVASPASHPFPPSPPDSSRCSSSPDSLRGSPKNVFEQGVPTAMLDKTVAPNSYMCCPVPRTEGDPTEYPFFPATTQEPPRPLNLTTVSRHEEVYSSPSSSTLFTPFSLGHTGHEGVPPSTQGEVSLPTPLRVLIKQERDAGTALPWAPSGPSSPAGNGRPDGNALALEAGPSSGHSFVVKSAARPTPYPKKDAVKRYQRQSLSPHNEQRQGGLSAPPWRPWMKP